MKLNLLQKAFLNDGKAMMYSSLNVPLFSCSRDLMQEAVDELTHRIPLLKAGVVNGKVITHDRVLVTQGHGDQHQNIPSCLSVTEDQNGFWIGLSHEFVDGWTFMKVTRELFNIARTGELGNYISNQPLPKIQATGALELRPFLFQGEVGLANTYCVPIGTGYLKNAKAQGLRVQDYLAQVACEVLDNPNILTTRFVEGCEDYWGHYSLYGLGSNKDGQFSLDISHENFTRLIMKFGMSEKIGNFFVGSFPIGPSAFEPTDLVQFLKKNQMGRLQVISYNGTHHLRIAFNKAIPNQTKYIDQFVELLS